jgi:hypothetical protein
LNPDATSQQLRYGTWPVVFDSIQPRPPTWPTVVLDPGRATDALIGWSNWCGRTEARWRVELPGGGTVAVVSAGGRCDAPEGTFGVSIRPFAPPPLQKVPSLPEQDFGFVPLDIIPGQPIQYEVTLTNLYRHPIYLTHCPSYGERLMNEAGTIVSRTYLLNCQAVPVIPAETAVVFAMMLDVPADAPSGRAELIWRLDPPNGSPRSVPVMITGVSPAT